MSVPPTYLADEFDAAWIVALWSAVHAGDPRPEVVAARAIAVLNGKAHQSFTFEALKEQFGKLGVTVTESATHEDRLAQSQLQNDGEAREFWIRPYCFKFEGSTLCTELPVLTHLRTAA